MTERSELQNEIRNLAIAVHELSTQVHTLAERVGRLEDTALSRAEWVAYRNGEGTRREASRVAGQWAAVIISAIALAATALNVITLLLKRG